MRAVRLPFDPVSGRTMGVSSYPRHTATALAFGRRGGRWARRHRSRPNGVQCRIGARLHDPANAPDSMPITDQSVQCWARPLMARWAREWRIPALADRVRVVINPRLSASLGRCLPRRTLIELSPRLLQRGWRLRREILCHELAHLVVVVRNGPACKPHGSEWNDLMRAAGFDPRTAVVGGCRITAGNSAKPAPKARYVYEHRCPVCQFSRCARRPISRWRCAACSSAGLAGDLLITRRATKSQIR